MDGLWGVILQGGRGLGSDKAAGEGGCHGVRLLSYFGPLQCIGVRMGASVQRKMTASCGFAACGMQQTYDAGQPYQSEYSCKV